MPNRFASALIAFMVLPGVVAGLVPYLIFRLDPWRGTGHFGGFGLLAAGLFLLLWTVLDFYRVGKGTLAPWSPPEKLVVTGLYRVVRNPMYLAVLLVLLGWSLAAGSPVMLLYSLGVALAFHLRVVFSEEPWLARTFPQAWAGYSRRVNRWLPRRPSRQQ